MILTITLLFFVLSMIDSNYIQEKSISIFIYIYIFNINSKHYQTRDINHKGNMSIKTIEGIKEK